MNRTKEPATGFAIIDGLFEFDWVLIFQRTFGFLWAMVIELYVGISRGTMPVVRCLFGGILVSYAIRFHWDYWIFTTLKIQWLYPKVLWTSRTYRLVAMFSGFVLWAGYRVIRKLGMQNRAKTVFENAGLKSKTGQLPKLISHQKRNDGTERMRVARSGISEQEFVKAKESLESSLGVFISSIQEERTKGTLEITYSKHPIPDVMELEFENLRGLKADEYYIGAGHTGLKRTNLADCPHLLVAGETGSGKSTFLFQFITTLYRKNTAFEFTLIDLKGGLEFSDFAELPGVTVVTDREEASRRLSSFPELIAKRLKLLRQSGAKSIEHLNGSSKLHRHIVIVDEAAEMFLSSGDTVAKSVLSQIARQGRALGIHLVIATQRPDTRTLDPQIKANLTGVLCFKMLNDASSITVLGNGLATELPAIPGRALWKFGPSMTELQVPLLSPSYATELLEDGAKGRRKSEGDRTAPTTTPERFKPIE